MSSHQNPSCQSRPNTPHRQRPLWPTAPAGRRILRLALLTLFAAVAVSGCKSTLTGNEGNLEFSYVADDRITDFNKPIAVGAKLDLEVQKVGAPNLPVTVTAASFDDPSVLDVTTTEGNTITIEGKGDGNVLLSVQATAGGEMLTDSVNLLSRVPEVLKLAHTCTDQNPAQYLMGQDIYIPFDMEMSNSQPVIGYGYYPVTSSPEMGLLVDDTWEGQQFMRLATSADTGAVSLASDIDDTTLDFDLVDIATADGAMLLGEYGAFVNINTWYYVLPTIGGNPICQANTDVTVETISTDVCTVERPQDNEDVAQTDENRYEYGWLRVDGLQVGFCEFEVTYPEANGGMGVTVPLQVEIIEVDRPEEEEMTP